MPLLADLPGRCVDRGLRAVGGCQESLSIAVLPPASTEAGLVKPAADAPSLQCELPGDMPLPLAAVAFSFDGKTLAVGGLGEVVLWDLAEGKLARRIEFGQPGTMVQAVAFARDGRTLVAGQGSPFAWGAVTLLDLQTGKALVEFREPKGPVNCLALSIDGRRLVAGCGDGAAYVYALDEKKLVATLKDHALPVLSASFSFDGKFLVTGGADAKLQTWDTVEWKPDVPTTVGGEVRHAEIRRSQIPKEGAALHTFAMIVGGREDRSLRVMLDGKAADLATGSRLPRGGSTRRAVGLRVARPRAAPRPTSHAPTRRSRSSPRAIAGSRTRRRSAATATGSTGWPSAATARGSPRPAPTAR